ncbi:MAG TPA: hypothetical protein DDX98_05125 [Bacteroidales bacterium]|nr:hypothetical protein [Bacteroidales bacterium]
MAPIKGIQQFIHLTKSYVRFYLGIAITVFLFILFFQPFVPDKFEFENKLLFLAGFGMIVLTVLLIAQIVFQKTVLLKDEEHHSNAAYEPLYYFFQIAAASLAFIFYIRYVGQINITFNTAVRVVFICLGVPVAVYLKFRLNTYQARLKKLLHESLLMEDELKQISEKYSNKHIEIVSESDADNFRIQVSDIVYVKSADNYVEVGYLDDSAVKKKMIRNTLKNVELQLSEFNSFIRTHRSALVNIQYIDKIQKSFNTYWLSIQMTKETVPVSRQYLMSVKELL